jgi:hypothetical protein
MSEDERSDERDAAARALDSHSLPYSQGFDAALKRAYERPIDDKRRLQLWCYTDRLSYRPGDDVVIHASTTAGRFDIEITRDGLEREVAGRLDDVRAPFALIPNDFMASGCGWPEVARWKIPAALPSGFYLLTARATLAGKTIRYDHGFFVVSHRPGESAPILLIGATGTWTAYNDWGGANHYYADRHPDGLSFAPKLTLHRPYSRGFLRLPEGAPRKPNESTLGLNELPRYSQLEFAFFRGYGRHYASAGWATYERPFAHWAEREGYALDFASLNDIHFDPTLLAPYRCIVFVGHDEYWSWEMREAVDRYVERGGRVLRLAGNFLWQTRLEDNGATQVCFKRIAEERDPVVGTARARRISTAWEDPLVGWPGAQTFGLNAAWGIYANFGTLVARGSGGFTIYRPDHWALKGTGINYGDVLGAEPKVFGYEVDGLDFTFRDGLPYPTFLDGAPESVEIIGMSPACNVEQDHGLADAVCFIPDETDLLARLRYGADTPENRAKASRGSGMMVSFTRGRGEVFNAGTCEWVAGLKARDPGIVAVTRNVLARFTS